MRLHDTVLRMRDLLLERGVTLTPGHADADAVYEGPGAQAREAWEAFRAVAVEPAFDPVEADGELQEVESAGFLFEAMFSEGWPARHGSRGMPPHYELMFTRQFDMDGEMLGLFFTIFVPAADELRTLRASFFDESDPEPDDPEAFVAGAQAWIAHVEADPAFAVPMTHHQAERFQFAIDAIG